MVVMSSTPLRSLRESLRNPRVSQEDLAHSAGVTMQTYRNAEIGRNCTYTTATAILKALNTELQERSRPIVVLEELGLSIV